MLFHNSLVFTLLFFIFASTPLPLRPKNPYPDEGTSRIAEQNYRCGRGETANRNSKAGYIDSKKLKKGKS
jgi:hypothetical protein